MAIRILDKVLPPATVQKKGGVIVGDDLSVTADGTLTIGGVIANVSGKAGCYLYTNGTNISWNPIPQNLNIDRITSDFTTNTYLAGNQGNAVVNSNTSNGAYVTLVKYNSTNGKMTINGYQGKLIVGYTSNTTIDAGTNALNKQITLIDESGNTTLAGSLTVPTTIKATGNITAPNFIGVASQAKYADLGEKYSSDAKYPVGTLVQFGGEKEITEATTEANAVISDKPGYLLNASSKGQAIALSGKTKVRIKGKVKKFDKIILSDEAGIGIAKKWYNFKKVIAIALEDNEEDDVKAVMCVTKLTF